MAPMRQTLVFWQYLIKVLSAVSHIALHNDEHGENAVANANAKTERTKNGSVLVRLIFAARSLDVEDLPLVLVGPEDHTVGSQPVPTGSAHALVELYHRLRQVVEDDVAHIGLIDSWPTATPTHHASELSPEQQQ